MKRYEIELIMLKDYGILYNVKRILSEKLGVKSNIYKFVRHSKETIGPSVGPSPLLFHFLFLFSFFPFFLCFFYPPKNVYQNHSLFIFDMIFKYYYKFLIEF